MSSGQRPRRREYFPRMKQRGKHRPRRARVIVHGADGLAVWPAAWRVRAGLDSHRRARAAA